MTKYLTLINYIALKVSKSTRFFKVRLQYLENETITLKNGQQLVIPKQLYEICCFIFNHVDTEGIFRKEGSRSRQHEIKVFYDIFYLNIFNFCQIYFIEIIVCY